MLSKVVLISLTEHADRDVGKVEVVPALGPAEEELTARSAAQDVAENFVGLGRQRLVDVRRHGQEIAVESHV